MKKVLKFAEMILLILVIGIFVLAKCLGRLPSAPKDYQKTMQTGGDIEARYMASGSHSVSVYEQAALQSFGKYIICYPDDLTTAKNTYPVIALVNGTGVPVSKYMAIAEHFATWGGCCDWHGERI